MNYVYKTKGVCSRQMEIELDDANVIREVKIVGGCDGNLKGIMSLVRGRNAEEVIDSLQGIRCGSKSTSCPDQLACALREALEK